MVRQPEGLVNSHAPKTILIVPPEALVCIQDTRPAPCPLHRFAALLPRLPQLAG